MEPTTLTEHCHQWNHNLTVDADQRIVRNVALAGTESKNGYTYSESALRNAVTLYEGRPVFLDHAQNRLNPHDRSTRDLVGSITNARFDQQRMKGDIRVLDTESGRTFLKLLEGGSPGVGMSHVVRARKSTDGTTVDEIAEVISVDVVINPATTRTFAESTQSESSLNKDDPSTENLAETAILHLRAEHNSLKQQHAELLTVVESLQRENDVHRLLAETHLPPRAVTEFFVQQLRQAPDTQTRRRLIDDRLALVKEDASSRSPVRSELRLFPRQEAAAQDFHFISAIRRT